MELVEGVRGGCLGRGPRRPLCAGWGQMQGVVGLQQSATASSGHRAENETGCHEKTPQHPGEGAAAEPEGQRLAE